MGRSVTLERERAREKEAKELKVLRAKEVNVKTVLHFLSRLETVIYPTQYSSGG